MVIELEPLFVQQLMKCPVSFQQKFRKFYQQLKVVDIPTEVKGVSKNRTKQNEYKLFVGQSRIALKVENEILKIICFTFNEYF
jgi:mRNA-degrading endonuclease RelE of RelBE toxin-antitoxin system